MDSTYSNFGLDNSEGQESKVLRELIELLQESSSDGATLYTRDKKDREQTLKPIEFNPLDLYNPESSTYIANFLLNLIKTGYALYVSVPNQPLKEINIVGDEQQSRWARFGKFFHPQNHQHSAK